MRRIVTNPLEAKRWNTPWLVECPNWVVIFPGEVLFPTARFMGETEVASLHVIPNPDSLLRVISGFVNRKKTTIYVRRSRRLMVVIHAYTPSSPSTSATWRQIPR